MSSFLSDVDVIASAIRMFAANDVPLEDVVFFAESGLSVGSVMAERRHYADPATIARLLAFAAQVEADAERVHEHATQMREDLRFIYQEFVIERGSREGS